MAENIDTGAILEALNTKVDLPDNVNQTQCDFVIDYQAPTSSNNYTWYRLYKSGWVEQGGKANGASTVTFPIEFKDTNYNTNTQVVSWSSTSAPGADVIGVYNKTTTTMRMGSINSQWNSYVFEWSACGMAAQS